MCHASFAQTGILFDVAESGGPGNVNFTLCLNATGPVSCQQYKTRYLNLNITTSILNKTYPRAGIKLDTPGYKIRNLYCQPISNGYCLFTASKARSANILIEAANDGPRNLSANITSSLNIDVNQSSTFTITSVSYTHLTLPTKRIV